MTRFLRGGITFLFLFVASGAAADPILIDFETFADFEQLTTQVAGVTFENGVVLTAEFSLGEDEFPPRSGANVAVDAGGPMRLAFDSPVGAVAAYFTYLAPVVLTAFDADSATLGTVASAFGSNLGLSGEAGSAPNELLSFASLSGIAFISIAGDPAGFSFALDDLTITPAEPVSTVPEPTTLVLMAAGGLAALTRRALRR